MRTERRTATMAAENGTEPPENGGIRNSSQTTNLPVRFYSLGELAEMTGLSRDTMRREIWCGGLTAYKFRGRWRIRDQEFEAWANRSRHSPADAVTITYEIAGTNEDYRW